MKDNSSPKKMPPPPKARTAAIYSIDDDAYLQGSFEYYRAAFPPLLRVIERAMATALKFIDHPKARQFDVRQSFDNSFIDEAMR